MSVHYDSANIALLESIYILTYLGHSSLLTLLRVDCGVDPLLFNTCITTGGQSNALVTASLLGGMGTTPDCHHQLCGTTDSK